MDSTNTVVYSDNRFDNILNRKVQPNEYWLPPSPANTEQTALDTKDDTDSFIKNIKIITPDEARKTNNTRIIGLSIAGVTVLTAAGLFALMRGGGSRNILQGLQSLRAYFEKQLERAKIGEKTFDGIDKAYVAGIKIIDNLSRKGEAVNNFSTFKDMLFEKIMNVTDFTGNIHRKITALFEHIGYRSVISHYNGTENKIFSTQIVSRRARQFLNTSPDELIEINGEKLLRSEWLERIKSKDIELQNLYETYFTTGSMSKRYNAIKQIGENLKFNLSKLKSFSPLRKDVYNKFLADAQIVAERKQLQKEVYLQRLLLSYSEPEMIKIADNTLNNITKLISYKDKTNIDLLKSVKNGLKTYLKQPENKTRTKSDILETLKKLEENITKNNTDKPLNAEDKKQILTEIKSINSALTNFKEGKVQEILSIYKHLLPAKQYRTLEKTYVDGIKSLDKSIKIETEDFVNKLRDLTLGSAPTDMLSMVGSLVIMGYYLGKSDNNDQRTSIALKYGIPAIAGIATSLYSNAKMYNGTKGLIFASISSLILNRIGAGADNYLKKYKENHNAA